MAMLLLMAMLCAGASAHGSMTHPRPRNAYSSPAVHPSLGADLSCTGDACYWYQVGCHIGCKNCTLSGKDLYPAPHCSKSEGLMEPTNNDPEFRTWDPYSQSDCGDFVKYNPWRAPGKAPVADPCGIASGFTDPAAFVGAVPGGYNAADKGSKVLPEQAATYWKAGGTALVGWGMSAQHGGGYSYRLCPKEMEITEACFQSNVLTFTGKNSTVHFNDGSKDDITIPTKTYVAPDGAHWRTNPVPACACDIGEACYKSEKLEARGACSPGSRPQQTLFPNHGSPATYCPTGTMFEAPFDEFTGGFLIVPQYANNFSVMDEVNVPNTPGKYVLSWRWDCEATDQVWNSCADVEIIDGPLPPTPAPTPPPTPAPTPPPSDVCVDFKPDVKSLACFYKGCQEYEEGSSSCKTCCEGCHKATDGTTADFFFCMEDTEVTV